MAFRLASKLIELSNISRQFRSISPHPLTPTPQKCDVRALSLDRSTLMLRNLQKQGLATQAQREREDSASMSPRRIPRRIKSDKVKMKGDKKAQRREMEQDNLTLQKNFGRSAQTPELDAIEQYELEAAKPRRNTHLQVFDVFDYISNIHKNKSTKVLPHLQPNNLRPYGSTDNLIFPTILKPRDTIKYPLGDALDARSTMSSLTERDDEARQKRNYPMYPNRRYTQSILEDNSNTLKDLSIKDDSASYRGVDNKSVYKFLGKLPSMDERSVTVLELNKNKNKEEEDVESSGHSFKDSELDPADGRLAIPWPSYSESLKPRKSFRAGFSRPETPKFSNRDGNIEMQKRQLSTINPNFKMESSSILPRPRSDEMSIKTKKSGSNHVRKNIRRMGIEANPMFPALLHQQSLGSYLSKRFASRLSYRRYCSFGGEDPPAWDEHCPRDPPKKKKKKVAVYKHNPLPKYCPKPCPCVEPPPLCDVEPLARLDLDVCEPYRNCKKEDICEETPRSDIDPWEYPPADNVSATDCRRIPAKSSGAKCGKAKKCKKRKYSTFSASKRAYNYGSKPNTSCGPIGLDRDICVESVPVCLSLDPYSPFRIPLETIKLKRKFLFLLKLNDHLKAAVENLVKLCVARKERFGPVSKSAILEGLCSINAERLVKNVLPRKKAWQGSWSVPNLLQIPNGSCPMKRSWSSSAVCQRGSRCHSTVITNKNKLPKYLMSKKYVKIKKKYLRMQCHPLYFKYFNRNACFVGPPAPKGSRFVRRGYFQDRLNVTRRKNTSDLRQLRNLVRNVTSKMEVKQKTAFLNIAESASSMCVDAKRCPKIKWKCPDKKLERPEQEYYFESESAEKVSQSCPKPEAPSLNVLSDACKPDPCPNEYHQYCFINAVKDEVEKKNLAKAKSDCKQKLPCSKAPEAKNNNKKEQFFNYSFSKSDGSKVKKEVPKPKDFVEEKKCDDGRKSVPEPACVVLKKPEKEEDCLPKIPECDPCPPPKKKQPVCPPAPSFWQKIIAYFKARPNCPTAEELRCQRLREAAQKAAQRAGLCVYDPNVMRLEKIEKDSCEPVKNQTPKTPIPCTKPKKCDGLGGKRTSCVKRTNRCYSTFSNWKSLYDYNMEMDQNQRTKMQLTDKLLNSLKEGVKKIYEDGGCLDNLNPDDSFCQVYRILEGLSDLEINDVVSGPRDFFMDGDRIEWDSLLELFQAIYGNMRKAEGSQEESKSETDSILKELDKLLEDKAKCSNKNQ